MKTKNILFNHRRMHSKLPLSYAYLTTCSFQDVIKIVSLPKRDVNAQLSILTSLYKPISADLSERNTNEKHP